MDTASTLSPPADIVIAPTAIHIGSIVAKLRPEVKVAVQDIHTAKVSCDGPSL